MSNTAYRKVPLARQPVEEEVEEEYVDYGDEEAPRSGLFSSPGRALALGGSVLALVAILSTLVWLASPGGTSSPTALTGTTVGKIAQDFSLVDVRTNQPVKLSALRGKPVWVNFWGTWCPPCRGEMPEMQKMYDKYNGQVQIVGVSMIPRDDPPTVKSFVDNANYKWTFIHDADGTVATNYRVMSVPSSYFIDKDGVIKAVRIGAMDASAMETYLQQIR